MKTRLAVLVLLGAAVVSGGVAVGGDAKAEMTKFQGTWAVEVYREKGKDAPAENLKQVTVVVTKDKVAFLFEDKEGKGGTFKINPTKKPPHIDLMVEGETAPGIYAFEGGKLKVCFGPDGERPTKYESPEGSKNILIVLKRAKK